MLGRSTSSPEPADYLERARAYWRYSPGGSGKVDSADLIRQPDDEFLSTWRNEKRLRRLVHWEEVHFVKYFSEHARGLDVFSFGCGLGYSELDLLEAGASVAFGDIVPSCVACVERLCRLTGHADRSRFLVMDDSADTDFGAMYDIFFAYGSLMHMPEPRQRRVLDHMSTALRPGGKIWLMLYTPKFVQSVGSEFAQTAFAKLSDPGVGTLENPWSDWHDDEKLQRLAGDGLRITRRETYNEDRYVWYQLERTADNPAAEIELFVDLPGLEAAQFTRELTGGRLVADLDMQTAAPVDATATVGPSGDLRVCTGESQFHYAVRFPPMTRPPDAPPNLLAFDADVEHGGFAIGLLDVAADRFFYSATIQRDGVIRATRELSTIEWPATYQVVVSNYSPASAARSTFVLRRVALLRTEGV